MNHPKNSSNLPRAIASYLQYEFSIYSLALSNTLSPHTHNVVGPSYKIRYN